jgi:hypothetical protein
MEVPGSAGELMQGWVVRAEKTRDLYQSGRIRRQLDGFRLLGMAAFGRKQSLAL